MKIKYPHTYHLPFSPGVSIDDMVLESYSKLEGRTVVITEKMDGENTTMYRDAIHARSPDSKHHITREIVKSMWGNIRHEIPVNYRICGENLYAKHSIYYTNLTSYFQVFGVWDGTICLSWQETEEWSALLGLRTVPVIYKGLWNERLIEQLASALNHDNQEGLVVRVTDKIQSWSDEAGKYVRKGHVQTSEHWMRQTVVPNKLIGE